MFFMRPVLEGKATLRELDEHWSIDDLADMHDAMDIVIEMEVQVQNEQKNKGK